MNTSDVDVITLDDSDDDGAVGSSSSGYAGPAYREEQMVRCNFCVDPGLLPVEVDRAEHRRKLHGNKLFYCEVCGPGEKGAKGFEEFGDIKKHVSRENGIRENDVKNLHDFIRVPPKAEYLKTFRCKFCPGEGMKFVGLPEDTFHEHIYNLHGTKAPRRKPEKLIRECRICGGNWQTDAELERHINLEHLKSGRENLAPFAGFGPVECESDEDSSSSEEEDGIQFLESRSRNRDEGCRKKMKSIDRDWHKETEKFINKVNTSHQGNRRPRRRDQVSSDSSEDEDYSLRREMDKVKQTRKQLERSLVCPLCNETLSSPSNLEVHLANYHKEQCFTCAEDRCGQKAWVQLEQALRHTRESAGHTNERNKEQLLARGSIKPPKCLESMSCNYCRPPLMIVGETWDDMKMKLFEHMEVHEDLHRGNEECINENTIYGCRMCEETMHDERKLDAHMVRHKRGRTGRNNSADFKSPASKRRRDSSSSYGRERVRSEERSLLSQDKRRRDRSDSGDIRRSSGRRDKSTSNDMMTSNKKSVKRGKHMSGEVRDMFGCTLCGKEFDVRFEVYEHVHESHGKPDSDSVLAQFCSLPTDLRVVKCKYCTKVWSGEAPFMLKATLRSHREEHREMHTSVNECYQLECRACPKIFPLQDEDTWRTHAMSHNSPPMKPLSGNPPVRSSVQCSYCLQLLASKRELLRHVASQHINQAFECVSCHAVFPVMSEIIDHMHVEHGVKGKTAEACIECPPDLRGVTCALCGWEVLGGGQRELELHLKFKHPKNEFNLRDVRFFCRMCSRDTLFASEKRMEDHVREHREKGDGRGVDKNLKNDKMIKDINKHLIRGLQSDTTSGYGRGMAGEKRRDDSIDIGDRKRIKGDEAYGQTDNRDRGDGWDSANRLKTGSSVGVGGRQVSRMNSGNHRSCDETHDLKRDKVAERGNVRQKSGNKDEGRQSWGQRDAGRGRDDSRNSGHDNWDCPSCKYDNFNRNRSCKKCNEPRPWDSDSGRSGERAGLGAGRGSRGRGSDRGRGGRGRGGRGGGRGGNAGGERSEDWICGACGKDNFARNRHCFKCSEPKGRNGSGNANLAPLGRRDEEEVDVLTMMRNQIAQMQADAFKTIKEKEEGLNIVNEICSELVANVMEQVEENCKRLDSKSYFKRDLQAGSPSVHDKSEGPYSPEYIAAPRSPDYTPAPDSPEYSPAPHSPVYSSPPMRNTCDPERPKTLGLGSAGYDSPMGNPSPTFQPASFASPSATPDLESAKFKCSFCMKPFDMIFECYDHLHEEHDVEDNEEILKSHCLEPFGATYTPVPLTVIKSKHDQDPPKDECSFHENIQSPSYLPSVSNIFLVPPEGTGSESGDSGAISGDEDDDILPPEISNDDDFKSLSKENTSQAFETKSDASSSGSSPLLVQTIEELEIAFAKEGDVKVVASEDLIKTVAYIDFMEKFNKNNSVGQTSTSNEVDPEIRDTEEVGNTSPVVSDEYFLEKSNETKEDSEKGEGEECSM